MDYPMGPIQEISYIYNSLLLITVSLSILVLIASAQIDKLIAMFPKYEKMLINIYTSIWTITLFLYASIIIYCIFNTFQ